MFKLMCTPRLNAKPMSRPTNSKWYKREGWSALRVGATLSVRVHDTPQGTHGGDSREDTLRHQPCRLS